MNALLSESTCRRPEEGVSFKTINSPSLFSTRLISLNTVSKLSAWWRPDDATTTSSAPSSNINGVNKPSIGTIFSCRPPMSMTILGIISNIKYLLESNAYIVLTDSSLDRYPVSHPPPHPKSRTKQSFLKHEFQS